MMKADSHLMGKNVSAEYPKFLYKYRNISNATNLSEDYALNALINNEAIFSGRKNFNDLFDSKIELIKITPREIKELKSQVRKEHRSFISTLIDKGKFTQKGKEMNEGLERELNKIIDKHAFFSVSSNSTSNLMWSHYAGSHTGFCIEFKSEDMRAKKITYQKTIPKIEMLSMYRSYFGPDEDKELVGKILLALRTKLDEWEYESEFRVHGLDPIPFGEKFIKIRYEPAWIESIIFGCRMSSKVKAHITQVMPKYIKYKQAVERMSGIEIVDIK